MILRPATDEDINYFFTLRCDPVASAMSRRRAPTWDEHVLWWATTNDLRYVAENEGAYVGTIRLSVDGIISIIVDPLVRGVGYGPAMLEHLAVIAKAENYRTLLAEIAWENERSQRAFAKAGWRPVLMELHL